MKSDEGQQRLNLEAQQNTTAPLIPGSSPSPQPPPHPRLHLHRAFRSQFLPDPRDIIVYLPPGYNQHPEQTYPALYLHDGQNLFDGRTSYIPGRTWAMREHADEAINDGEVEPLIIVGIYNAGDRRLAEYTPEPNLDRDWPLGGGEAASYGRLITEDLMPFVANQYRIRAGREHTGVGGSSLGGLVSLYLGLRFPHYFGKLAVLSPSVWWNHKSILGYVNEYAPNLWERPRLWLDVGDQEGLRTLENAEQLHRRLKANGWKTGESLYFERVAGGTHDEASWARRVRPFLSFLFPASRPAVTSSE